MKRDHADQSIWSRREVFRVGSMATAAGVMGGIGATDAAASSQAGTSQLSTPAKGPQVYTQIGVRPFINLTGTFTINGGALELPEVREACHQAADYAVDIDELMEKVGARIAELVGCEGAIVSADLAGRWDVDVHYSRGTARHKLLLITRGNHVEGSHIGRRLQGGVSGTVDGDRVRLRSSLPCEGTQLTYRFDGTVQGQTIEGEVNLGEYGKARWTARRMEQTSG